MFRPAIIIAAIILALAFGIIALRVQHSNQSRSGTVASKEWREVEDCTGRKVKIPTDPKRVLSLCTSATDTILRLGGASQLAAIDEYSRVVPGASNVVVIGKGAGISQEQVLARGIDLALIWWYQEDVAGMLSGLGIPVVRIRCGRAGEVPHTIRLVGECLNKSDVAERLADDVNKQIHAMTVPRVEVAPRIYLELYGPFKTIGRDSYLNDLIEYSGGRNIAENVSGSVLFSSEQLMRADPDVVLLVGGFTTPEALAQRSGMSSLKALKDNRVIEIDRYWLVAGAGFPEAVTHLRSTILKFK